MSDKLQFVDAGKAKLPHATDKLKFAGHSAFR